MADVAAALEDGGVTACFGIPGGGPSSALVRELDALGIPFHLASHEASAAIMAGAYGRRSGELGCCLSIKGPGLANMVPGLVADAYEDMPVLAVSEAYPPAATRMHKRLDHRAAVACFAKAHATLGDPTDTIARLAAVASREVPGPVHLDLFEADVPEFIEPVAEGRAIAEAARLSVRGAADVLDEVLAMVGSASRPAVIVGGVATRGPWGSDLGELSVPVLTTLAAKGVLDERVAPAAGIFTGDGKEPAPEGRVLAEADLVVGLGLRNTEVLTPSVGGRPLVMADIVGANARGEDLAIGFDPRLRAVLEEPEDMGRLIEVLRAASPWGAELAADAKRALAECLLDDPWSPARVFALCQEALPHDTCLVLDTGLFATVGEHLWLARTPDCFLASANGRFMGTGIPMAVGTTIAVPAVPTVCAVGDGGIRMYAADIRLAVELGLPILFVLMTDGRFASVHGPPAGGETSEPTIPGTSWYKAIAEFGCPSARADSEAACAAALAAWDRTAGPFFLEAVFDADVYATMTEDIR